MSAPVFFVGAPKCGTTGVLNALSTSGLFSVPLVKEPLAFCDDVVAERPVLRGNRLPSTARERGASARPNMHMGFVASPAEYERLYDAHDRRPRLDGCTFNFASRDAPMRIARHAPDARIVVLAREPARRIRSHHAMDVAHGYHRGALADTLASELSLGDAANFANSRLYLRQSDYGGAWRRYRACFPAEQVALFVIEELASGVPTACERFRRFLGLPDAAVILATGENAAVVPRNRLTAAMVRSPAYRAIRGRMANHLPASVRARWRRTAFRPSGDAAAALERLDPSIEREIARIRRDVETLLGRPVTEWRPATGAAP